MADVAGSASEASFPNRESPHNSSISAEHVAHLAIEPLLQKLNANADQMERLARDVEMMRVSDGGALPNAPGGAALKYTRIWASLGECRVYTYYMRKNRFIVV